MEENIWMSIWKVIKIILLVITAPVWGPWKLLFVRKEGRKFNEVDSKTKTLRLIRSPFTKTFKFIVFVGIIFLEILIIHKVRYSVVTYPLTKNAVVNYYLNENRVELEGMDENYKDLFQTAFDYIDEWSLDEKNKMNVILNSDVVKDSLKYATNDTISYVLNKFNTDEGFRENVRNVVKNINSIVTRFINEIPRDDFDRLNTFLKPIISVGSWAIDYAGALDIGGAVFNWAIGEYNIQEKSLNAKPEDIEKSIKTMVDYSNGSSLQTVLNYWK